jgi:hypothetical protein
MEPVKRAVKSASAFIDFRVYGLSLVRTRAGKCLWLLICAFIKKQTHQDWRRRLKDEVYATWARAMKIRTQLGCSPRQLTSHFVSTPAVKL